VNSCNHNVDYSASLRRVPAARPSSSPWRPRPLASLHEARPGAAARGVVVACVGGRTGRRWGEHGGAGGAEDGCGGEGGVAGGDGGAAAIAAQAVRCHKGWADLSAAFPHFATKDGPTCQKGWAEARVVPERMGRRALGGDGAGAGSPGVPGAADGAGMRHLGGACGGGRPRERQRAMRAGTEAARQRALRCC